jgi:ketol-acid reductoisomerase
MPSRADIYYDNDADLSVLDGKQIVFFGFGNQGSAQAQNLRDSGIPNILIANLRDSYAKSTAQSSFPIENDFAKAAAVADVLFLLVPDQVQPGFFNTHIAPKLKHGATIIVASGYNVFYKLLDIPSYVNVCTVAPRMIGSSVRSRYQSGKGFPCFVSVEQVFVSV